MTALALELPTRDELRAALDTALREAALLAEGLRALGPPLWIATAVVAAVALLGLAALAALPTIIRIVSRKGAPE